MQGVTSWRQVMKAIAAAVVAAGTWFATSFIDGGIQASEWAILPLGMITAFVGVFEVKNAEIPAPTPPPPDPNQPGVGG